MQDLRQTAGLLLQTDLATLYAAHIQYIVDQTQQMIPGRHDLLQIPFHLVPVFNMGNGQGGESHNGIHGRTDIMGHIGEEHAFGLAGFVCLGQCILQKALLLHFPPYLRVHTAEAQNYAIAAVPASHTHHLHLEILCYSIVADTEIRVYQFFPRQLLLQIVQRRRIAQHLLVLLIYRLAYVVFHTFFQRDISTESRVKEIPPVIFIPECDPLSRIQVKGTDQVIVDTKRLDQFSLMSLVLIFLLFLLCAVQKESLAYQSSILHEKLDIAHHV